MADYAIGLSFHKAHRTLVRAVELTPPCRYFATRSGAGYITLPTLDTGSRYVELQGIQQSNFQISDADQEFRLLGDDGWSDSVITGSRVQVSNSSYFMKDTEVPADQNCPVFRGGYDEGFSIIEKCRSNKNREVYIEVLKEMGQADGDTGNWIYDFTGFNCVMLNFNEGKSAEGLTQISFDMMSRGRPVFGLYDAGSSPIAFGGVNSRLLETASGTGDRRYAVVPADNAVDIVVSSSPTVTYTSDGTVALTQLTLGTTDGDGFVLENASSGAIVPVVVSLGGAGTNVVTINPVTDLAAATIYRLIARDGAIMQAVDGAGLASPTGYKQPLQGFTTTFRTA